MTTLASSATLPIELSELKNGEWRTVHDCFRIALLIPLCGSAGIWAPSCISSAQVAAAEVNESGGIGGRKIQLIMIDAAMESQDPIEETVNELIEAGTIDAIVGMHISAIRQRLSKVVRQRIPYIYTPLYEGGENTAGLFAIGETPEEQLGPALSFLQETYKPSKWALIGNDYVWPRSSNAYAKSYLKTLGASPVIERYIPFGATSMMDLVAELDSSGAEALLLSLVGQDAVAFNRAFGKAGLHRKIVRLTCAIEENGLLACGERNLERLFVASSYFAALPTEANAAFKERYYAMHGDHAPVLNALGQSMYEGIQYLSGLMRDHGNEWRQAGGLAPLLVTYRSGRRSGRTTGTDRAPIYIARADGMQFSIIKELNNK